MFAIHCHICGEDHLVSSRNIVSMHQTSNGPVAYVRCLKDHLVVHEFRQAHSSAPDVAEPGVAV